MTKGGGSRECEWLCSGWKDSKKSVNQEEYHELVGKSLAHVIRNEAENEHYTRLLESLGRDASPN